MMQIEIPPDMVQWATPDINQDGWVDLGDLMDFLPFWGPCTPCECCPGDINQDGVVGGKDLLIILAYWDDYDPQTYPWFGPLE